jgi:magnesium transporter
MVVDCAHYVRGVRQDEGAMTLERAATCRRSGSSFVWIELHEPGKELMAELGRRFNLHELALEDALKAHQRPKVEEYADSLFVVLKTVRYDEPTQQIELGDLMAFVGDSFIVTVRHGQGRALSNLRKRLEAQHELLDCGPSAVLYAIADKVVDDYQVIAAAVEEDIEEVEQQMFSPERSNSAERIYNLKREVIEFRHAVLPLVEPMSRLASGAVPHVHERMQPFFRDIADHAVRVSEQVQGFDDLLTSVLNANLAQVSVQQNEDMRRISAWVAIAAVPTAIAGIYGMNFDHMPELRWQFGYPAVLALMAVICLALYRGFKRNHWL